ncbi:hypothetical protein U1708_11955 [Sphingomonas sp. ZB1N12]|uniref:hypothetical protein n=1 Tax=Sphingomonas arabinosi TaxID=3096160 RepID=UPI002FC808B3
MIRIAVVVEGYGDVQAMPVLIGKIGGKLGKTIVSSDPIRAGEWPILKKIGKLERCLDLAASREPDVILVALDLDDGCPVNEGVQFQGRVDAWLAGRMIPVASVFLTREYETMFLHCPVSLGHFDPAAIPAQPNNIRGAKERIRDLIGRRYRETQDQKAFTAKLDMNILYRESRPFRRMCKAVSGMPYNELNPHFGIVAP